MAVTIDGTTGIDKVQDGSIVYADLDSNIPLGTKNLIINGDMRIAQRGTSTASITSGGYYTADRIQFYVATAGTWTMTQDTDVPSGQGFSYSTKVDCTTADASLGANDIIQLAQRIEGQNLQHLKYGTSNAESLTLSFWVKTNKTGTYVAELRAYDASSGTRIIAQNYTVSSANTWEKKTLTYVGDTATAIRNTNTDGLVLYLWLAAGSTFTSGTLATSWQTYTAGNRAVNQLNLADSTSNYINITGVQLEVGENATPFEYRMYSTELALCKRYYQIVYPTGGGIGAYGTVCDFTYQYPVEMRASPTAAQSSVVATITDVVAADFSQSSQSFTSMNGPTKDGHHIRVNNFSGLTNYRIYLWRNVNTGAYITYSAEL